MRPIAVRWLRPAAFVMATSALSVDIFVLDWLPPMRVHILRIPDGTYVETDAAGDVPRAGSRPRGAAVVEARFDETDASVACE